MTPSPVVRQDLNYSVVASDLDGTICELQFVHEDTKAMVAKLQENGVILVPATGRGPQIASEIFTRLGLPAYPAAYHHGALTYDESGDRIVNLAIGMDVVEALVIAADRMRLEKNVYSAVIAQCKNIKYVVKDPPGIPSIAEGRWDLGSVFDGVVLGSSGKRERTPGRLATIDDMGEDDEIYQATLVNAVEEPPEIIQWQKEIIAEVMNEKCISGVKSFASGKLFIDTIHKDADKSLAVAKLGEKLGFTMSQVLALGDNQNDIGLLSIAGKAVAMGNARTEVKEVAHYTTDHIRDGGWSNAVAKFVFSN
eukprot:GHVH01001673.1.p1 GENE.GHVH01001673.1~~GHVH01001673.1.p1  ORF type:complete len:336 (+),score=54.97 GHVH01001673.1:84-1010(+)